jgi:hypothetical protein
MQSLSVVALVGVLLMQSHQEVDVELVVALDGSEVGSAEFLRADFAAEVFDDFNGGFNLREGGGSKLPRSRSKDGKVVKVHWLLRLYLLRLVEMARLG